MTFRVEIKGLEELRRAFREYPKISEPILQRAIVGTQAIFAKHTLKDNPVPWKTGILLMSFRFTSGRLQARWSPTAKYAAFVEFGTKPHVITPVNKRVLAWTDGGSGQYVTAASGRSYYKGRASSYTFAMRVNHPGTKPNPFMGRIVQNATPDINTLMKQALDIVGRSIANRTRV